VELLDQVEPSGGRVAHRWTSEGPSGGRAS
jgi:hypothetical protein